MHPHGKVDEVERIGVEEGSVDDAEILDVEEESVCAAAIQAAASIRNRRILDCLPLRKAVKKTKGTEWVPQQQRHNGRPDSQIKQSKWHVFLRAEEWASPLASSWLLNVAGRRPWRCNSAQPLSGTDRKPCIDQF